MTDGEAELARVAPYVAHLHLKDSKRGYHEWYFPALGEAGGVDFANVGRILKDAGYAGDLQHRAGRDQGRAGADPRRSARPASIARCGTCATSAWWAKRWLVTSGRTAGRSGHCNLGAPPTQPATSRRVLLDLRDSGVVVPDEAAVAGCGDFPGAAALRRS